VRRTARTAAVVISILAALYVLFTVVFPWIDLQLLSNPVLG